jgi:hypothetical protein
MPWIDADFTTTADRSGVIQNQQTLTAPASGKLKSYRVKTTSGCAGRTHPTELTITRSDDPGDSRTITASVSDCTELENDIDPPYRVQSGKTYEVQLSSGRFSAGERIDGTAGVFYSLFLELSNEGTR